MATSKRNYISVFGVNHESLDLKIREQLVLSPIEHANFLSKLASENIQDVFVLNSCNRTEIFAMSELMEDIINLYINIKNISKDFVNQYFYSKSGRAALYHIYEVGNGLRSEYFLSQSITNQIKTAYFESDKYGLIGENFENLFQNLFAASKQLSESNKLSRGSASYTYQIAKIINDLKLADNKKVLLIGAGDLVRKTLNHLEDYCKLPIKIVNKTNRTLSDFNGLNNVTTGWLENLPYLIQQHDVIISTIPVDDYIIKEQVKHFNTKVIFDLTDSASLATLFAGSTHKVYGLAAIEQFANKPLSADELKEHYSYEIINGFIHNYGNWVNSKIQNERVRTFDDEAEKYINWYAQSKLYARSQNNHAISNIEYLLNSNQLGFEVKSVV